MNNRKRKSKEVRDIVVLTKKIAMVLIMKGLRGRGKSTLRNKKWMMLSLIVKEGMKERKEAEKKEKRRTEMKVQAGGPRKSQGATKGSLSVQAIMAVIVINTFSWCSWKQVDCEFKGMRDS